MTAGSGHDPQLLRDFLLLTGDLPRGEVARIAGVSVPTLQRWERTGTRYLRKQNRLRLMRFVAARSLFPSSSPRV